MSTMSTVSAMPAMSTTTTTTIIKDIRESEPSWIDQNSLDGVLDLTTVDLIHVRH